MNNSNVPDTLTSQYVWERSQNVTEFTQSIIKKHNIMDTANLHSMQES